MIRTFALSLAAALLPLSGAAADEPQQVPREIGAEASIVFPSDTTIRNWRADREHGIWVQARRGAWHYARFAGFCRDVIFAPAIGCATRGQPGIARLQPMFVPAER